MSIYSNKRRSEYQKFLFKFIAFLAITFFLDLVIGSIMRDFYFKQQSGEQYRTTYLIEESREQLLILGSSRANHHYVSDTFNVASRLTTFNGGRDGNFILYETAVLKSILKRYRPKVVVLDFLRGEFEQNEQAYARLSSLLPYYDNHPELRPIIQLRSKYEKYKVLSNIYPFNSYLFTIAIGNMESNKTRKPHYHGYVPISGQTYAGAKRSISASRLPIDEIKVKLYKEFINDCKENGISLRVVCSPYYAYFHDEDESVNIAKKIAAASGIPFYDLSALAAVDNPNYFADYSHLNDRGARIFSSLVARKLFQK